jgi:ribosomal-protein-serine acetyltransferase
MTINIDSNLDLKQLELADSIDIFNSIDCQREYLGKWLPFVAFTKKLEDTERFVASMVNAPKDKFEYIFTIRCEKKFVGLIGFKNTDRQNKITEIGYWLSEKQQKKGIMTKSVERLCDFAFNDSGLNRVEIKCAVENKSSANIPRKLNFKFEGIERDGELLNGKEFTDLAVYSRLAKD